MYVPEELKLNRFKDVKIPSNKDYFQRLGRQALPAGQYTGDEAAQMPSSKIDTVTQEEQRIFDEMRQAEEDAARAAAVAAKKAKQPSAAEPPAEPSAQQ